MTSLTPKPTLPSKIYLRRADVEKAVGGDRQMKALEAAGKIRGVRLTGYTQFHYVRAEVQAVLDEMWGK